MNIFKKINNWLSDHKVIAGLLLFLLAISFFGWLESAPTFSDPDSFYHTKMAVLMGEQGIIYDFPYLQFTTLKTGFIDHHLLYHLYLVPFVKLFSPLYGAKIGHVLLVSLSLLTLYWLLIKFKVKGAIWYIIVLLFVEPFIFRLSLIKAQPLSLIVLFIGTYLITARKHYSLALLAFVYVWSYGGWFLLLIITILYVLVESLDLAIMNLDKSWFDRLLYHQSNKKKYWSYFYTTILVFTKNIFSFKNIKLITSVLIGLILGLIINLYFLKNFLEFVLLFLCVLLVCLFLLLNYYSLL